SLHRILISGSTIRSKNKIVRRFSISDSARSCRGNHHLCPGNYSLGATRLAIESNDLARRRASRRLHRIWWDENRKHHSAVSDSDHLCWDGSCLCHRGASTARRIIVRPCPNRRRWHGKTTGGRFLIGPGSALHVLVGNHWRIFSRTLVFRRRPVSGSTVSRRRVVNRQPIRSPF